MKFLKSLYIHPNFFKVLALGSACFLLSFWIHWLYPLAWVMVLIISLVACIDLILLYRFKNAFEAKRWLPKKFSNSDDNLVHISLHNRYPIKTWLQVIDELPAQFQKRDFEYRTALKPNETKDFSYTVRPVDRGEYIFGNLNVFVSTGLKIIKRKFTFQEHDTVAVYPSFVQMQKYDFLAISNHLTEFGFKKIRRIGHTQEFEQIKEYVPGNDFRTINWKATAKTGQLMVNQYQDERSQPIYSIIDTGRVMKMPFEGLKLLDYAINASLAFSNVALKKHDKVGLLTFSKNIEAFLPAQDKLTHLNKIMDQLYHIDTQFQDSDFGRLYAQVKRQISHRSMLMLYTNSEHISALKRQLPSLQAIAKKHLLVVIIFENTELEELISSPTQDLNSIYHKTIAEKFSLEKYTMVRELQKHGIQTILTKPENLTVNAINKYLEVKAKGLL
ncbi:DUF58 domain-containing protein [Mangrovimonas futianensis]|uniref:DUF58 domain-containing protein n=1 Tax=Mangrovimonas futianensis TaxID=2895523 RepID=UPI001E532071|nr:DUF58 domain-containing protein [Mangrovimonas futianensis]MCF1422281.1 DUF58 domain-containing protein [Mangrovimonas futianensis]